MNNTESQYPSESLRRNVEILSSPTEMEKRMMPKCDEPFPSVEKLREAVELVRRIVFPDFTEDRRDGANIRKWYIGVNVERLYHLLCLEIGYGLRYENRNTADEAGCKSCGFAEAFINRLAEVKRLLYTDVQAIYNNDPAVDNIGEVILCYPVVQAMVHHRIAHVLWELGVPVIPRILTELAHSITGIDIHPGARIGEYFAIDHGTGVVIGETCVIGNHVTIYQGVTLGAKNFSLDSNGHPINIPRHPIIEDNVTIYSNATVLGRITVGHDSIVGGNVWLTESVAPHSKILQQEAVNNTIPLKK